MRNINISIIFLKPVRNLMYFTSSVYIYMCMFVCVYVSVMSKYPDLWLKEIRVINAVGNQTRLVAVYLGTQCNIGLKRACSPVGSDVEP